MTSSTTVDPWGDPAFEQRVRDTAYFMWEQDGQPGGREQEYWYAALEKCLRQHDADKELMGSLEYREGLQTDDNIDDLGRKLSDPNSPPVDQPATKKG